MAILVLFTHSHYSIDVFSPFFITYCSHKMGNVALDKIELPIKSKRLS